MRCEPFKLEHMVNIFEEEKWNLETTVLSAGALQPMRDEKKPVYRAVVLRN